MQNKYWGRGLPPQFGQLLVETNGAGITNTIRRAELAATAAVITRDHTHIATDSLTSLLQIKKQLLYPRRHSHHVQGDILKILPNTIRNSQSHIFLYQHKIISGMITERNNVACRLIMKAISKGSLAGCLVQLDTGSTDRLAQQNLPIPEHANNRTLPSWLFDARLSARDRLTSSRPDTIFGHPVTLKTQIANRSSFAPGVTTTATQQRCTQSSRAQCQ